MCPSVHKIRATYDDKRQCIEIDTTDVDLITLGVTIEVLKQQYDELAESLPGEFREEMRRKILEATNNAKY